MRGCVGPRMEEPGLQQGPGREENLLRVLEETALGLRDLLTARDHQEGRVGKRRRVSQGEEEKLREKLVHFRNEGEQISQSERVKANERGMEGGMVTHEEVWKEKEREAKYKLLRLLREFGELHTQRVTTWREALQVTAHTLSLSLPERETQEQPTLTDEPVVLCSDHVCSTLLSVEDDIKIIVDRLYDIRKKLDTAIITLSPEEGQTTDTETHTDQQENTDIQNTSESQNSHSDPKTLEYTHNASDSHDSPALYSRCPLIVCTENGDNPSKTKGVCETVKTHSNSSFESQAQDVDGSSSSSSQSDCKGVGDSGSQVEGGQRSYGTDVHQEIAPKTQIDSQTERKDGDGTEEKSRESGLVTLGLTGRSADDQANIANACFVRAPGDVARVMTCEVADALSSLMVIGSEELVSRVLRVKVQDGTRCPFPVTVAMPFRARYHGNYRDFMVKVVDGEKRASYISPVSTQGIYGGQMGSFAEVRLYSLGLLAVVSCLRRENYTVPRRGLSLKLSMDPRACLDYLPGSFTAPVVAQSMLQPVDATLLATLKSRSDAYHEVLSTSPLLYLTHPSSQGLRRPLTLTLPCPTNPDKRRVGQGEEPDQCARPISAVPSRDMPTLHRVRAVSASVKFSRELPNGLLVLLGWRDEQWNVLDQVIVRNLQNGLVSFELTENFERLVVVRLLSFMRPSYLTTLVEEVEDSVQRTMVSIVLQRRREKPHMALVAALPSRDLSWELSILRAQGYCGPPEPSLEIPMCEGEQLLLSFNGNITSTGSQSNQNDGRGICEQITFHSQRKNRLHLCLTEVDPFGNYSSPHYKGMAVFHKITRDQLEWREGKAVLSNSGSLKDPVCKLSLTLPKKVRPISRYVSAKVITHDQSEPLSDSTLRWLSEELSEENLALMVLSFRLRRSSIQLVRLQAPDSLAAQAYHVLGLWRRALPAAPHPAKAAQLARCLTKSGRPDLAKELLLRQAATRGTPEEPEE